MSSEKEQSSEIWRDIIKLKRDLAIERVLIVCLNLLTRRFNVCNCLSDSELQIAFFLSSKSYSTVCNTASVLNQMLANDSV